MGRERHCLTRTDGGKIALSIVEGSYVRILSKLKRKKIYDFDTSQCAMQCRPLVQNGRVKRLLLEDFLWWVAGPAGPVFVYVFMYVCPSIFASGARTAGLIGSGGYSFDARERRNDKGNSFGPIACTWHVPRRSRKPLEKSCSLGYRPNQWTDSAQTWWAKSHYG